MGTVLFLALWAIASITVHSVAFNLLRLSPISAGHKIILSLKTSSFPPKLHGMSTVISLAYANSISFLRGFSLGTLSTKVDCTIIWSQLSSSNKSLIVSIMTSKNKKSGGHGEPPKRSFSDTRSRSLSFFVSLTTDFHAGFAFFKWICW